MAKIKKHSTRKKSPIHEFHLVQIILFGIAIFVTVIFIISIMNYFFNTNEPQLKEVSPKIETFELNSFDDCVEAGGVVLEIYPRQCRTTDGFSFTEDTN